MLAKKKNRMKKKLIIGASICFILLITGWAFRSWMPSHERIHSALPPHSFYSFTLTESDARIPCLQAEVEGIPFQVELDIGHDGILSLPKHLLEQLTYKSDSGTVFFAGIRGKKYEAPVFTVPKLYVGDLAFVNVPVEEGNSEFEHDANLQTTRNPDPPDIKARIGWQAFSGMVILIDLNKSIAICCDSLETLKERGHAIEQFVSTNFLPRKEFIEFEADIGNRTVKCLLDTGCTLNLIHTPLPVLEAANEQPEFARINFANPLPAAMLSVGGSPLGPCIFYETQLPFGVEAIIGVDFLETQIVCIDFINRKLLLCPVPKDDSSDPHATLPTSPPL